MRHTTDTINGVTVEFGYNDGADIPITVRLSVGKSAQVIRTAWIARSADKDQMAWPNMAIGYLNRLRERHDLPR